MERGLIISAWWAATPDRNMTHGKNKRFVLLAWATHSLVPTEKAYSSLHWEEEKKKNNFKDIVSFPKWRNIWQKSQIHTFYLESWLTKWKCCTFCFVCGGKVKGECEKQTAGRKWAGGGGGSSLSTYFLSWSEIKFLKILWNTLPHKLRFVLLYCVCSYENQNTGKLRVYDRVCTTTLS